MSYCMVACFINVCTCVKRQALRGKGVDDFTRLAVCVRAVQRRIFPPQYYGSTWLKNEVRHDHFKSCRNPTWPFIKTVESDVKVL